MRLIDADAIHKFVEEKVAEGKDGWANGVGYEWAWTLTAIDMQPTIDPESLRPQGEWVKCGRIHGFVYCSNCRDVYLAPEWLADGKWTFCPNCGAKMKGADDHARNTFPWEAD